MVCATVDATARGVRLALALFEPASHTIPYHTIPYHTIPYNTIPYIYRMRKLSWVVYVCVCVCVCACVRARSKRGLRVLGWAGLVADATCEV